MLGLIITWEFDDPDLQREHFLTVASYNLQHPAQFTDAALAGLWSVYVDHIDHNLSIAQIRKRVGLASKGATRVLKPPTERRLILRHWTVTIRDVYHSGQPQGAADRVRAWASSIRQER
jgi:hypothetical protein